MRQKLAEKIEDIFLEYSTIISVVLGIISSFLYAKGYITNILSAVPNIIMIASIIFVVIGFILTLFIALRTSPLFERIKTNFQEIEMDMYKYIYRIIAASITVALIALFINVMPSVIPLIIKILIAFIGCTAFWYMILGAMYMLKFTIDLIAKDDNYTKTKTMK